MQEKKLLLKTILETILTYGLHINSHGLENNLFGY